MGAINGKNMNMDGTMLFFCCQGNIDGNIPTQGITNIPVMCTSADNDVEGPKRVSIRDCPENSGQNYTV